MRPGTLQFDFQTSGGVTTLAPTGGTWFAGGSPYIQSLSQINGTLQQVEWSANGVGSIWLTESGTGIELWRNNAPSGAGWQAAYPSTLVSTGSPYTVFQYPLNSWILLNTAGGVSGTTVNLRIRYQAG